MNNDVTYFVSYSQKIIFYHCKWIDKLKIIKINQLNIDGSLGNAVSMSYSLSFLLSIQSIISDKVLQLFESLLVHRFVNFLFSLFPGSLKKELLLVTWIFLAVRESRRQCIKLPKTFSEIIFELSLVYLITNPLINSKALLLIKSVATIVDLCVVFVAPYTVTMTKSLLKVTFVKTSINPEVMPISMGDSIGIITDVDVPIGEIFLPWTEFETIGKAPLVIVWTEIVTLPMRESTHPFPWVHFMGIKPIIGALTTFDSLFKGTQVGVPVCLQLVTLSAGLWIMVYSFENGAVVEDRDGPSVHEYTFAFWRMRHLFQPVETILVPHHRPMWDENLNVESEGVELAVWVLLEEELVLHFLLLHLFDVQ